VSYDPDKASNKALAYIGKAALIAVATQPLYVSSEIGNVDSQTITITVDQTSNYDALGITLSSDGAALTIVANTAGDGTITGNYSLNRVVLPSETITISVAVTNGITGTNGGLQMVDITAQSVTNNASLEFVVAAASTATLTDNGSGNFINTGGTDSAYFVATKKLVSSGRIRQQITSSTNHAAVICLDTTNILEARSAMDHQIYISSGNLNINYVANGGSAVDTGIAANATTVLELEWVVNAGDNDLIFKYSLDGGASFTTITTIVENATELFIKGAPIQLNKEINTFEVSPTAVNA
jgi:hypothetical protein